MAKICIQCNKENRDFAKFCTGCGYKFYPDKPSTNHKSESQVNPTSKPQITLEALIAIITAEDSRSLKDLNATGDFKQLIFSGELTPLHLAAQVGNIKAAKIFLAAKIDVNMRDKQGSTPLLLAIEYGNFTLAEFLIQDANADVNIADNTGITPLDAAIRSQNSSLTKLLIEKGANVIAVDSLGWTPLRRASFHGNPEIIKILTDAGAVPYTAE